ncbi:hypothetical protein ENTCAN_08369 [Enterobacter cancerogenus ATCC 35316]|nr:hypothetical protein ENTCAN_08369 [Enterobacter cancerogenus ATCC 35316]
MALRLPDLQDLNTVHAVLSGGATLTRPTRPEHRACHFVGWRCAYPTYGFVGPCKRSAAGQ